jgi:hypothetical protein
MAALGQPARLLPLRASRAGWRLSAPARSPLVRQAQRGYPLLVACLRQLTRQTRANRATYPVLDLTPVPVRDAKRRGRGGLDG